MLWFKGPLRLTLSSAFSDAPDALHARCIGTARAIDGREGTEVDVRNEKVEVVLEFCYPGDMLSA